jgi:hypothetical protein
MHNSVVLLLRLVLSYVVYYDISDLF